MRFFATTSGRQNAKTWLKKMLISRQPTLSKLVGLVRQGEKVILSVCCLYFAVNVMFSTSCFKVAKQQEWLISGFQFMKVEWSKTIVVQVSLPL